MAAGFITTVSSGALRTGHGRRRCLQEPPSQQMATASGGPGMRGLPSLSLPAELGAPIPASSGTGRMEG